MPDTATQAAAVLRQAAQALEQSDDDVIDMRETSRLVNRDVTTLRYWRYHRTGPPSFRVGGRVMYRRGAVRAWLAAQEAAESGDGAALTVR